MIGKLKRSILGTSIALFLLGCVQPSKLDLSDFKPTTLDHKISCGDQQFTISQFIGEQDQLIHGLIKEEAETTGLADTIDTKAISAIGYQNLHGKEYLALFYSDIHADAGNILLHGGIYMVLDLCTGSKVEVGEFDIE